jgi:hypothetical protein
MSIGPLDHLLYLISYHDPPIVNVIDIYPAASSSPVTLSYPLGTLGLGESSYQGIRVCIVGRRQVIITLRLDIVYVCIVLHPPMGTSLRTVCLHGRFTVVSMVI